MFNRFLFLASLLVLSVGFMACEEADTDDGTQQVTAASYSGMLSVDQLDTTFYETDSVIVTIEPLTDSTEAVSTTHVRIVMHQVRFSPRMPIALDMTINEVAYVSGDNGVALSGDSIVPVAMGGPFPTYIITNLQGLVKDNELTLSMKCGRYPLTYSGSLLIEPASH